jgi:hypothetical protein
LATEAIKKPQRPKKPPASSRIANRTVRARTGNSSFLIPIFSPKKKNSQSPNTISKIFNDSQVLTNKLFRTILTIIPKKTGQISRVVRKYRYGEHGLDQDVSDFKKAGPGITSNDPSQTVGCVSAGLFSVHLSA